MRFPKPTRKANAPRQRIARKRRPSPVRRTKRAATLRDLAYLWRVKVREKNGGRCIFNSCRSRRPVEAAHCFGTDEAPALRLTLWNGLPLCRTCHEWYERRKMAWHSFLRGYWGAALYSERLAQSRSAVKVDLDAARAELVA